MIYAAEVTNWPERILLTFATLGFMFFMFGLMRRGWKNKLKVQAEIATPMEIPTDFIATRTYEGRYLPSTAAGAWLTRIAVHDLGVPSRVQVQVGDSGIAFERTGARSFFVPKEDIQGIRADRAIAGKAYEKDGIAVLTWNLDGIAIDTGFRADAVQQHLEFLAESNYKGKS